MKRYLCGVFVLTAVLSFVGCTKAVRYSPEEIKEYPPLVQEQIKSGSIAPGMTTQQVRYSWGPPSTVRVLSPADDGKPKEEWIYMKMSLFLEHRLLFIDGKLADIFPEPRTQQTKEGK